MRPYHQKQTEQSRTKENTIQRKHLYNRWTGAYVRQLSASEKFQNGMTADKEVISADINYNTKIKQQNESGVLARVRCGVP